MNEEFLRGLTEQHKTIKQISIELDCSQTNVRYWLKKFSIKTKRGPHGKRTTLLPDVRKCGECDETDSKKFYGHKRSICGKCQNQYNIESGRKKKAYMRKMLGGKCAFCEYSKYQCSLDVHHLDPKTKDHTFNASRGWSYEKIDEELKKCILLCRNCHMASLWSTRR